MKWLKVFVICTSVLVVIPLIGCSADRSLPGHGRFFQEYKTEPHYRAISTTGSITRKGSMSAYFKGASSVEEAIEGALQSCEEGKKENTWENPIGECKLYAIGDIIVSGMTEREIKETIIRYQLAVIETDPNLRDLSPGLSRRGSKSFVDYKRKVHFRAFATTEAGGERESVHGRSWRSSTVQEATKRAVEQCEKARSNEGITSECKLYAIGNIVVYRMSPEDLEAAMTFYQANFDADNDEFDALVLNDPTNGSANLLSEAEIRAMIIGNTMTEFSTRYGSQWTELYLQDGTIKGAYLGDRGFIAEWYLHGSEMCWDYSPGTQFDGCWSLALNGDEVVFYEEKKAVGRAQLLQGNPKGLGSAERELNAAAESGDAAAVERLLAAGAEIDHRNADGSTALMLASQKGHGEIVEALLGRDAALDVLANSGQTALSLASKNGHGEIVEMLLAKGAAVYVQGNDGGRALIVASESGHGEIVEALLAKGAELDVPGAEGTTALISASQNGHGEIVETLLAKGAKIDVQRKDGATALIMASQNGHGEIVEALLARGAAVDVQGSPGTTALIVASKNGHGEIVEALLAKGAAVDVQGNAGETALIMASQNGHGEIVEALLAKDAALDVQANNGATALILASKNGHGEIVEALLAKGADTELRGYHDETALDLAKSAAIENMLRAAQKP